MKRELLTPVFRVSLTGAVRCDDVVLPNGFWSLFMNMLNSKASTYSPVTLNRVYPFLVSHVHSSLIQNVLVQGAELGLFTIEERFSSYMGPSVPPSSYKVIIPQ